MNNSLSLISIPSDGDSTSGTYKEETTGFVDPSVADGHRLIREFMEVPIEVRVGTGVDTMNNTTVIEIIHVKILVLGPDDAPTSIRIELSSEADLFFYFHHNIQVDDFSAIQEKQRLVMISSCILDPTTYISVLTIVNDKARLDIIQNMEYKFIELMHCTFERLHEEIEKAHIVYRYNMTKKQLLSIKNKYSELAGLVKAKNPSIILQLQKDKQPQSNNNTNYYSNNNNSNNSFRMLSPPSSVSSSAKGRITGNLMKQSINTNNSNSFYRPNSSGGKRYG
eukprot:gene10875-14594_t